MAKGKSKFECSECGYISVKWMGKCADCGKWNSLVEVFDESKSEGKKGQRASISSTNRATKITEVDSISSKRIPTDIGELDRVLGGGVVIDSVVLLSAEPGSGKSTILLQCCQSLAKRGMKVLYCSGEESETQIKSRGDRLFGKDLSENILVKATNSMDEIKSMVDVEQPQFMVVDSIQTVSLESCLPSRAGGGTQVTECTNALIGIAKPKKIPIFIVGQVTKESELAGVKYLEHAVDVVLKLEGDKNLALRTMMASKNRFGSTEEIGLFEMTSSGMASVENPNALFTTQREDPIVGCSLTSVSEGSRSFVVEIQSLVTKSVYGMPLRNAIGLNKEYIRILASMLEARTHIKVSTMDINLQVTGGLYIKDVGANLGIIMSIVSSYIDEPIPEGSVFVGEVGLTGEITNVQYLSARVKAMDRYGFKKVYVPVGALGSDVILENIEVVEVRTLMDVIGKVFNSSNKKRKTTKDDKN